MAPLVMIVSVVRIITGDASDAGDNVFDTKILGRWSSVHEFTSPFNWVFSVIYSHGGWVWMWYRKLEPGAPLL